MLRFTTNDFRVIINFRSVSYTAKIMEWNYKIVRFIKKKI